MPYANKEDLVKYNSRKVQCHICQKEMRRDNLNRHIKNHDLEERKQYNIKQIEKRNDYFKEYRKKKNPNYKKVKIHLEKNRFRIKIERKDLKIDKSFKSYQEAEAYLKTFNIGIKQ